MKDVFSQPTIKPLTAYWVYSAHDNVYRCSRCHYTVPWNTVKKFEQCPECGSFMRKASKHNI